MGVGGSLAGGEFIALFAAHLTGKKPAVVIYNTDGKIGRYEHRSKVGCERAGGAGRPLGG